MWSERPTVEIDLAAPMDRRVAVYDDLQKSAARRLLRAVMADIPSHAWPLADAVNWRTLRAFEAEAKAFAAQFDVKWREIVLANISYDLVIGLFACSTIAMATTDGPVLARNLDWWPEDLLAQASVLHRFHRAGETAFWLAGFPGGIGCISGLSANGFAVVLNAVGSAEGNNFSGYPVLLWLRRVVETAKNFDDAVAQLAQTTLASACLLTVVGRENHQRVCVERTPRRHALRWADGDAPLFTTNDFRRLDRPAGVPSPSHPTAQPAHLSADELYDTACSRYDALGMLCAAVAPTTTPTASAVPDEFFLKTLTHPRVRQSITAQHVIIRPRHGHFRLFVPPHLLH